MNDITKPIAQQEARLHALRIAELNFRDAHRGRPPNEAELAQIVAEVDAAERLAQE